MQPLALAVLLDGAEVVSGGLHRQRVDRSAKPKMGALIILIGVLDVGRDIFMIVGILEPFAVSFMRRYFMVKIHVQL